MPQTSNIPDIFYPTQIVMIEDNLETLEIFKNTLAKHHIRVRTFHEPESAFRYLESLPTEMPHDRTHSSEVGLMRHPHDAGSSFCPYTLLQKHLECPTRHDEISVILCDYHLPGISGADFFSILSHRAWRRILLTGDMYSPDIEQLLLQKTIHQYIQKRIGIFDDLIPEIQKQQIQYLNRIAYTILGAQNNPPAYAEEREFQQFFNGLIQEFGIVEYCTISETGSKLMIDAHRQKWRFTVNVVSESDHDERSDAVDGSLLCRLSLKNQSLLYSMTPYDP